MLADQAHQRDQSDLGIDVQGREPQVDEDQRAKQRHRHRHQDHDRIAEAFELRGERQKNNDHREQQGHRKAAGFLHELARHARVIGRIAARRNLGQRLLHEFEHLILRNCRRVDAEDARRVELLEVRDAFRHDFGFLACDRGRGNQ